jgi:hypothetical protein
MFNYATHYNGEYTQVYPLEECFRAIACRDADKSKRIEYLEQQVKELKDEHYKDKRLQELTEELNKVRADARRGFSISAEESEAIAAWKKKHDTEVHGNPKQYHGVSGGGYSYSFYLTGIGTIGRCVCSQCDRYAFVKSKGDPKKHYKLLEERDGMFTFSDL